MFYFLNWGQHAILFFVHGFVYTTTRGLHCRFRRDLHSFHWPASLPKRKSNLYRAKLFLHTESLPFSQLTLAVLTGRSCVPIQLLIVGLCFHRRTRVNAVLGVRLIFIFIYFSIFFLLLVSLVFTSFLDCLTSLRRSETQRDEDKEPYDLSMDNATSDLCSTGLHISELN